jgi:hypothetical protein
MRFAAVLLVTLAWLPALASQPGQPIDESDFQPLLAGTAVSIFVSPGECAQSYPGDAGFCAGTPSGYVIVSDSCIYTLRLWDLGRCAPGSSPSYSRHIVQRRCDGQAFENVIEVDDRCNADGTIDAVDLALLSPDLNAGRIMVLARSFPRDVNANPVRYDAVTRIDTVTGLTTEFEVLQTFTPPSPSAVAFRVPYMPEGMGGSDHFDTYWGALTQPIDFKQAHPLQCGYPATPPKVGDYLTVADTLPTPSAGKGYYYVTATTYQGQRRDGRQVVNGKLVGRDPAVLPACVQP